MQNRMTSKRLLEDDSVDQTQYGGSPASKRRRHENHSEGMQFETSSSRSGVPSMKVEQPSPDVEVPRAPENNIIDICKSCTSGKLTKMEFEIVEQIQFKIDSVFNQGAKSFDILSDIRSNITYQPPERYGFTLKPEHNRKIADIQKRMKDAQTQFAAQRVNVGPPSTPRNRKIKDYRGRSVRTPSAPLQSVAPVEKVIGMFQLTDESKAAVIQTANNLLASKNLKITVSGSALHLIDLATQ
jgi:hypothetical protein